MSVNKEKLSLSEFSFIWAGNKLLILCTFSLSNKEEDNNCPP